MTQRHKSAFASAISRLATLRTLALVSLATLVVYNLLAPNLVPSPTMIDRNQRPQGLVLHASAHVVLAKDDRGQHLVLTGEDGKKGKGGDGDQLVISGTQMGADGQGSQMVLQNAAHREGDIVMDGKSWIIPGEEGHIVLADARSQNRRQQPAPINPLIFWGPYMSNRYYYRMMMMVPYLG